MTTSGVFDLIDKCHPSTIRFIIRRPDANFNLNQSNNLGQTPMMLAATRGGKAAEKIIEYLIDYGANYEKKDALGRDILFYSVMFGLDDTAANLLMTGAFDLLHQDLEGRTILFHAVTSNRIVIARLLCSMMTRNRRLQTLLYMQDRHGTSVFQQAASLGHTECLKILLTRIQKIRHERNLCQSNTSSNYAIRTPQIVVNDSGTGVTQLQGPRKISTREKSAPAIHSGQISPQSMVRRGQSIQKSMELLLNLQAYRELPTFRSDSRVNGTVAPVRGSPKQPDELDAYRVTELRFKEAEREKRKQMGFGSARSRRLSRMTTGSHLPRLSTSDSIVQQTGVE